MKFNKGILAVLLCLWCTGCQSVPAAQNQQTQKEVEATTDTAEKDVEHDFHELATETTDSIKEDNKTESSIVENPKDLMTLEEDMAEDTK